MPFVQELLILYTIQVCGVHVWGKVKESVEKQITAFLGNYLDDYIGNGCELRRDSVGWVKKQSPNDLYNAKLHGKICSLLSNPRPILILLMVGWS